MNNEEEEAEIQQDELESPEVATPEDSAQSATDDIAKGCFGTVLLFILEIGLFILGVKFLLLVAGIK